MKGTIFDVKRFAIHDGPGIRTTVFLKGCPLRCVWCHNPEGISESKGLWVMREKCVSCGTCVRTCPEGALSLVESVIEINRNKCTFCDACVRVCPTKAIQRIDRNVDSGELADELLLDEIFFRTSGGGVTLSGGEPLAQPEFAIALLTRLKEKSVNTCVETALMVSHSVLEMVLPLVDHFFTDIKIFDDELHREYVGASNFQILENFTYLATRETNLTVRIPLIPGITATEANLKAIASFVHDVRPGTEIELLNYNWISHSKYDVIGENYFNTELRPFSDDQMLDFRALLDQSS